MDTVVYFPKAVPPLPWLKRAALMWDRALRITAPEAPEDPTEITVFSEALGGFLGSIHPAQRAASNEVFATFLSWLDARGKASTFENSGPVREVALYETKYSGNQVEELIKRGIARRVPKRKNSLMTPWERASWEVQQMESYVGKEPEYAPGSDAHRYHEIERLIRDLLDRKKAYPEAVSADIERLKAEAEAIRSRCLVEYTDSYSTIALPSDVAEHFLSLVAASTAGADLMNSRDRTDVAAATMTFAETATFRSRLRHGHAATAIIEHFLPGDLDRLSAERIAELRTELMLRRVKYQIEVNRLVKELDAISSEDGVRRVSALAVALANERIDEVRAIYSRERLETVLTGVTVSLTPPAVATCLASLLGIGLAAPAGVAAALGVFSAERLLSWRDAVRQRRENGWSYLADLSAATG